ncbi:rhomboid family intramembrane serine protease [Thermoleophilia bacterium SCSIO 60948]|nr:rhomboid family intramembrane serine protease [Thermoleophilia bacterium SCSIO 60948]
MSESSSPELSVVCKNCGAENSPYVTECPYCGNRLRRRAPKLERVGDEVRVQETRRDKSRRKAAERRAKRGRSAAASALYEQSLAVPYVSIAVIAISAVVLIVATAVPLFPSEAGAIAGLVPEIDFEPWRYVTAPFVYGGPLGGGGAGYLFACGLAMAIFLGGIERRIGSLATALLALACGAVGMLGAVAIEGLLGADVMAAGGGNGIALGALGAWYVIREAERRADPSDEGAWPIAIVVSTAVLLALPAVVGLANLWAGIVGGILGLLLGFVAVAGRRHRGGE